MTRGREGGVEGPGRGAHRGFRPMGGGRGGTQHASASLAPASTGPRSVELREVKLAGGRAGSEPRALALCSVRGGGGHRSLHERPVPAEGSGQQSVCCTLSSGEHRAERGSGSGSPKDCVCQEIDFFTPPCCWITRSESGLLLPGNPWGGVWKPLLPRQPGHLWQRLVLHTSCLPGPSWPSGPWLAFLPCFPGKENSGLPRDDCSVQRPLAPLLKTRQTPPSDPRACTIRPPGASLPASLVALSWLRASLPAGPQHSSPTAAPGPLHLRPLAAFSARTCPAALLTAVFPTLFLAALSLRAAAPNVQSSLLAFLAHGLALCGRQLP